MNTCVFPLEEAGSHRAELSCKDTQILTYYELHVRLVFCGLFGFLVVVCGFVCFLFLFLSFFFPWSCIYCFKYTKFPLERMHSFSQWNIKEFFLMSLLYYKDFCKVCLKLFVPQSYYIDAFAKAKIIGQMRGKIHICAVISSASWRNAF